MPSDFGRHIDHTLLRSTGTTSDVSRLCREARDYDMAAVCVFPSHVSMAREILRNTRIKVATVIAFPFGVTYSEVKAVEMRTAASMGANEADIVINISLLKSGADAAVEAEMQYLMSIRGPTVQQPMQHLPKKSVCALNHRECKRQEFRSSPAKDS